MQIRDNVTAALLEAEAPLRPRRWQPKFIYQPGGAVEVLLDLETGWVISPVSEGWIAAHSISAVIVRDTSGAPQVWQDKTAAQLELERLCPDCYGVDLPAPCATCEGTGVLGLRKEVRNGA